MPGPWKPDFDLYRTPTGWVVKLDLAGVRPGDLRLAVEGGRLRVTGVRRDLSSGRGWRHQRLGIAYARFERLIVLPDGAGDPAGLDCSDGMVCIEIPARELRP